MRIAHRYESRQLLRRHRVIEDEIPLQIKEILDLRRGAPLPVDAEGALS